MSNVQTQTRLPLSGNAALAAGALIQLVLGVEFVLAGLDRLLDRDFAMQLEQFVGASPGAKRQPGPAAAGPRPAASDPRGPADDLRRARRRRGASSVGHRGGASPTAGPAWQPPRL